jgi:UDP-N-acetylmuramate: L-alanyl-gamma-D-glutamyl-meso-diaminopimelate ligase
VHQSPRSDIRYLPYHIPTYQVKEGITTIEVNEQSGQLSVFGEHNLLNLEAARLVGEELGIHTNDFLQAMESFSGAAKRLELLAAGKGTRIFRDFAHAPSKVAATIAAVRKQFPDHHLLAVLELHTFSSLNEKFLHEYKGSLDAADRAVVFYTHHALQHKKLPPLDATRVAADFGNDQLAVINDKDALIQWLYQQDYQRTIVLLMSSGTFDGADMLTFAKTITAQ